MRNERGKMIEALEAIVRWHDFLRTEGDMGLDEEVTAALAALSKARGESNG